MRSLVDQTAAIIPQWLGDDVPVHSLLGGEGRVDSAWRERPGRPTVVVGTIDMLLSRALLRGYASSRWVWPIDFGLLHAGVHWVFDEVQLLGPALATSRQLDAFRASLGTAAPCSTTWMSATLDPVLLRTVDNPDVPDAVTLTDADREAGLATRLGATRLIGEIAAAEPAALAHAALESHRGGTLTLVIVNTVKRAQDVYAQLRKQLSKQTGAPAAAMLHSRFRPVDRQAVVDEVISTRPDPEGPGTVLVTTQVVEAGVDISAATLLTDAAPWSSIVQRAGRCNRSGERLDARLLWTVPPKSLPYETTDLDRSVETLRALAGHGVTSSRLRAIGKGIRQFKAVVPVLRRRDLLGLFDTSPDLIGNDIDVSRFIRDSEADTDIQIAWRDAVDDASSGAPFSGGSVRPEEMCSVPIGDARAWLKGKIAWTPDHLTPGRRWKRFGADLMPGAVVVVDAREGGYATDLGWSNTVRAAVPVVAQGRAQAVDDLDLAALDDSTGDDSATFVGAWITLDSHLTDTEREVQGLLAEWPVPGLTDRHQDAVIRAAALHDLGKAHEVFQETMVRGAPEEEREKVRRMVPLAKSGTTARSRHSRPHFRHELVSALMLAEHDSPLLDGITAENKGLVRYLVAAHHGKVRLAIRSMPRESAAGRRIALGVIEGDIVPAVSVRGAHLDPTILRLDVMALGGEESWSAMALGLRDRADLGLFRLGTLEALVRLADWRASANPGRGVS